MGCGLRGACRGGVELTSAGVAYDTLADTPDHAAMGGAHLAGFLVVGIAFAAFMGYLWSQGDTGSQLDRSSRLPDGERWLTIALLVVAGAGHVPVMPDHLREAPYMGVLFIAFSTAALLLAGILVFTAPEWLYVASILICAAAVLMYATTRLVALPQLADDVGQWVEPLGVLCVVTELLVIAVALRQVRALRDSSVQCAESAMVGRAGA